MAKRETEMRPMSKQRFETILEAYGACSNAWPSEERQSALAFLDQNPDMNELLQREAGLDDLLGSALDHQPSAALRSRVLASVPATSLAWWERVDEWAANLLTFGKSWQPIGALIAAAALGIGVGILGQGQQESASQDDSTDMAEMALGDTSGFGELQ
mgnify:CR=1 FL=1